MASSQITQVEFHSIQYGLSSTLPLTVEYRARSTLRIMKCGPTNSILSIMCFRYTFILCITQIFNLHRKTFLYRGTAHINIPIPWSPVLGSSLATGEKGHKHFLEPPTQKKTLQKSDTTLVKTLVLHTIDQSLHVSNMVSKATPGLISEHRTMMYILSYTTYVSITKTTNRKCDRTHHYLFFFLKGEAGGQQSNQYPRCSMVILHTFEQLLQDCMGVTPRLAQSNVC